MESPSDRRRGGATITPLDLVPNGSSSTLKVQNIVRFLMLMDSDGDPTNGITISEGLRERAEDWPAVDFETNDLEAALANIIPDTSVDGEVRALPSAADAQAHVEAGVRCLYSGLFQGTYSGEDNGRWAFLIGPTGILAGAVYSTVDQAGAPAAFTSLFPVQRPFTIEGTTPGTTFSLQLTSFDTITGSTAGNEETLTGTRIAGLAASAYKIDAFLVGTNSIPVARIFFDISDDGQVTGVTSPNLQTNTTRAVTGTFADGQLNATVSNGPTITATLHEEVFVLEGDWSDATAGTQGTVLGLGCKLH